MAANELYVLFDNVFKVELNPQESNFVVMAANELYVLFDNIFSADDVLYVSVDIVENNVCNVE